jgi:formylglycine-generating enzyme required for sulfatase activity
MLANFMLHRVFAACVLAGLPAIATPPACPEADLDGNGLVDEADLEIVRSQLGRVCEPRIGSVSPTLGATSRETTILIEGSALGDATSVTIGGEPAASIEAVSPTAIRVVVAASATPGAKDVLVTTRGGTTTLASGFRHVDASLPWAETIEVAPDPNVVTDAAHRSAIEATGLPWRVRDPATGIELLLVPPGSFTMGSPIGDPLAFPNETPAREVTISKPFYLGRTEMTRAQWQRAANASTSNEGADASTDTLPIDGVSWSEAATVLARHGLRLPTEAEWEYACRGGEDGPIDDLSKIAWHWPISGGSSQPVASKIPNGFGFHDMIGNAFEWVADWYGPYSAAAIIDPRGAAEGESRVVRGGSWYFRTLCSPTRRYEFEPETQRSDVGLRVARDP